MSNDQYSHLAPPGSTPPPPPGGHPPPPFAHPGGPPMPPHFQGQPPHGPILDPMPPRTPPNSKLMIWLLGGFAGLILISCGVCMVGALVMGKWAESQMGQYDYGDWDYEAYSLMYQDAPPTELKMLGGETVSLDQHLGKDHVVLLFWSSADELFPAQFEQAVNTVYQFQNKNVVLYTINVAEAADAVSASLATLGVQPKMAIDADKTLATAYHVTTTPHAVVIDPDGMVINVILHEANEDIVEELKYTIESWVLGEGEDFMMETYEE